jgi:hypothetical protein
MHMSTVVRLFIEDSNQQNLQSRTNDRTMIRVSVGRSINQTKLIWAGFF